MGLLDRIKRGWTLDGVTRPWPAGRSIYEHLRAHTVGGVLAPADLELPDSNDALGEDMRWAAGARDGVLAFHAHGGGDEASCKRTVEALRALFQQANAENLATLASSCTQSQLASHADGLVDALNEIPGLDAVRVHQLGMVLAKEAPHPELVKLGITLLGMIEHDDREVLLQLGLHDELTMFAVVALIKQNDTFEPVIWDLAKRVHGWGRIHAVSRLAETHDESIRAWLLREGFRNSVLDEYLAHLCATTGELHRALERPDAELLAGAAGLFRALATGGPAADWADYEPREAALDAWLPQVTPTLEELAALDALAERSELSPAHRARIESLRDSQVARAAIDAGLQDDAPARFGLADAAARARAMPTFDRHEARVREGREVTYSVLRMMQDATAETVERALTAAASVHTLDGSEQRLGLVLHELTRFPANTGAAMVRAGLRSSTATTRARALTVIGAWGLEACAADLREALARAAEDESDEKLRAAMEGVLTAEPARTLH